MPSSSSLVCHRFIFGALALLSLSCSSESDSEEAALATSQQALAAPARSAVLGFEVQGAWTSSSATLALSTTHTQGQHALEVSPTGWNEMVSAQLGSLGAGPVRSISYDVRPPSPPANPWWFGETQLYVTAPSQGIWNRYLGRFDLLAAPPGQFTTVTYQVPDDVAQKLAGSYSDLTFSIVLNTPAGSKSYLLDNLRFNGKSLDAPNVPDCPRFVRVLSNGDVVAELTTASRRTLVELVVRRNGVDTTSVVTPSEVRLQNGTYTYSATLPKSSSRIGDVIAARFRSRAVGSSVDQFSPGPDATKFGDSFSYDPSYVCLPVSDLDGDGLKDSADGCPSDPDKPQPGACGCGYTDTDSDQDGALDCVDECPNDPKKFVAGDCGCSGAYAAAGTACTDGPCPGKSSCDGQGTCGNPLSCLIPGTVGLPRQYRFGGDIFWLQPNEITAWQRAGELAPSGYARVSINDAQEVKVLASQIKKYYGSAACIWTSGKVTAPGVISSVPRNGAAPRAIWDQSAQPPNLGNAPLPFAPGQPPPGVSSGCVTLRADGLLRVEDCERSCALVYERPSRTLIARANPADFRVGCQDFPGVVCDPLDGYDTAAESDCIPASQLPAPGSPEAQQEAERIEQCKGCQQQNPNDPCTAVCQGMAAPPSGGRVCDNDAAPQFCRVTVAGLPRSAPDPALRTCSQHADCSAGQVCGVYGYEAANDGKPEAPDYWQTAPACTPADLEEEPSKRRVCRTVRLCGAADPSCDLNAPSIPEHPECREPKVCVIPQPVGNPDPTQQPNSELSNERFDPSRVFETTPELPRQIRDEVPPANPTPANHPWCKFQPSAPSDQAAKSAKAGEAGNGSFVQLKFDPNLDLSYELRPLAQGDLDFTLRAFAKFKASAAFELKGKPGSFDIIDAEIGGLAERCRIAAQSKLDIFGIDFIPLITEPDLKKLRLSLPSDEQHKRCEAAIQAFQEVATRAKKAMRDAQELLNQYHDGLSNGACFNPQELCGKLMDKAPPGFPKIDCGIPGYNVEDVVNSFVWYYERQLDGNAPLPSGLRRPELHFDIKNPSAPDLRLPNPRFPTSLPSVPSLPDLTVSSLPDLAGAQEALAAIAPRQKLDMNGAGCTGDKVKTERRTLTTVRFALGPVPMLLEVEGVLKYGINYDAGFAFEPQNLLTTSSERARVASVEASAEPCASAGIALFVGTGFSMGGFKAAAGVEGMVNLVTLSMPAHASASIEAAREQVDVLDPLSQLPKDGVGDKLRYVAKEYRGLWDGTTFPLYRQKIYLGYDYGARVEADEILKGKLSAMVAVRFWRFKKKWRSTLVNFGNEDHSFARTLIQGDDELEVASGPFPWATLDMPDAFVKFRLLSFVPPELTGLRFSDLRLALRNSSGSDFTWPSITLPDLSRLKLDLPDLTALRVPEASLPEISARLGLTLDELKLRFQRLGIDLSNLRFADFAKIGFKLIDLRGLPVSDDQLLSLDLDLSGMLKLGFDLSKLSLGKLGLPSRTPACSLDVDRQRVGDFFFDNYCPHSPPPTQLNELVSFPPAGKDIPGSRGDKFEGDVVAKLPGKIRPESLRVLIEAGTFDDQAAAISQTASIDVSSVSKCDGTVGEANGANVAPVTVIDYDSATKLSTVTFRLRATDVCGTHVGWAGLKVRYQALVE